MNSIQVTSSEQRDEHTTTRPHKWTYASASLYSLTLITTIGMYNQFSLYNLYIIVCKFSYL